MSDSSAYRYRRGRVRVHRAKHSSDRRIDGHRNWLVDDCTGGKVFIRRFTFSYFGAALKAADSLTRTGLVDPKALFGVHRIEYPMQYCGLGPCCLRDGHEGRCQT